jgi:hypothetical protein
LSLQDFGLAVVISEDGEDPLSDPPRFGPGELVNDPGQIGKDRQWRRQYRATRSESEPCRTARRFVRSLIREHDRIACAQKKQRFLDIEELAYQARVSLYLEQAN